METNVSHSVQACQVLNIAACVMCHCQMYMVCEQLHNSCNMTCHAALVTKESQINRLIMVH